METGSTNQVMCTVNNSGWEEKLLEELRQIGILPSLVEVAQGQVVVIPSEQPFWYTYCQERKESKKEPLILISSHGDYVGPTTESFETRFWDLMVTLD